MCRPLKVGLLTAMALFMLAFLITPLFLDRESLRRSLAEQISNALGRPVSIESLQIALLPRPTVTLTDAVADLGQAADARLAIRHIHAALSWRALLRGRLALRHLDVEGIQLDWNLIARIRGLFPAPAATDAAAVVPVRLHQATIRGLTWKSAEGAILGPFDANLSWKDTLQPTAVELRQTDGRLLVRLVPDTDGIAVALQAEDWAPAGAAPWRFRRLSAEGRYADHRIEITSAEGQSFGGRWQFTGTVAWGDVWQVDGGLAATGLELPQLLALANNSPIPGRIGGECSLSLRAATPGALLRAPELECALRHRAGGGQAQITLRTKPAAAGLAYELNAANLTLPIGPALHAQELEARGLLHGQALGIDKVSISAYRGHLEGSGELRWGRSWQFRFEARAHEMAIEPILATLGKHSLSGLVDARCSGRLLAVTFSSLGTQPTLGCEFRIAEGVIYNTDLERAASLVKRTEPAAGSTPFETLEGRLQMAAGQTRFEPIRIHSSALEATGAVNITPARKLSGELSVGLKNTGGMVSVPLAVGGTTDAPVVRPTNSALAGGAAGTLMMGPGIGTAIGVKVGEAVQKLGQWLKPKTTDTPASGPPTR